MILHCMLASQTAFESVKQSFVVDTSHFGLTVSLPKTKGLAMGLVLMVMMLPHLVWREMRLRCCLSLTI